MSLIGAIEAGGTKFVLALARPDGTIVEQARIATRDGAATLAETAAWFGAAQQRHGAIAVFGIGSFGPLGIDPARGDYGVFAETPKPGWTGASFGEALAQFGAPLAVDTDVNAAALGEARAGAGRGCGTLAYTTIGTGIGTGVVTDGRALKGWSHYESGHFLVRRAPADADFPGICPFHGDCAEGLANGPAILARWGHDLSSASPDQVALIAGYAAQLAAALVLLHRPERLIFGGGVSKAPGFVAGVRTGTRDLLAGYLAEWDEDLTHRIVPPELGDQAGITGAIALGQDILEGPRA